MISSVRGRTGDWGDLELDVGARTRNQNNQMPDNVVGTRSVACWSCAAAEQSQVTGRRAARQLIS
jgi:hypothetical protein